MDSADGRYNEAVQEMQDFLNVNLVTMSIADVRCGTWELWPRSR